MVPSKAPANSLASTNPRYTPSYVVGELSITLEDKESIKLNIVHSRREGYDSEKSTSKWNIVAHARVPPMSEWTRIQSSEYFEFTKVQATVDPNIFQPWRNASHPEAKDRKCCTREPPAGHFACLAPHQWTNITTKYQSNIIVYIICLSKILVESGNDRFIFGLAVDVETHWMRSLNRSRVCLTRCFSRTAMQTAILRMHLGSGKTRT